MIYKKLAGQTLVYGLGTIVPKILNYSILTVYYTRLFPVEQFGIITELYAYVAFLMILLTYGTETGFFKFAQHDSKGEVYGSLLTSLFTTSVLFIFIVSIFSRSIARSLEYEGNVEYIILLAIIVGIDAFSTVPFARLRKEERSIRFAWLKIINVLATIVSVLFFYELIPYLVSKGLLQDSWNTASNIRYVLVSNLIASAVVLVFILPELQIKKIRFNGRVLKEVLAYSLPLLVAGLAGTINETLDRVLLRHMVPDQNEALYILGIYGANYRIGVLLFIFIQMFRYAVEPFYFNYQGKPDEHEVFARIMRLFITVSVLITMGMLFYLKYVKFFIAPRYHEGLLIVPIILIAYIFYGIFFNQSIWYKLHKKTGYAILLTAVGASCTLVANIFFVKRFSYMAAAYGHLVAYFLMMLVSYFLGRRYYRIDYNLLRIGEYILVALLIFAIRFLVVGEKGLVSDTLSALFIFGYAVYVLYREKLLNAIFKKYGNKNSKSIKA